MNVVVSEVPFHLMAAPLMKPVPVTVKTKAAEPTEVLEGLSAVSVSGLVTVNEVPFEVTDPGLTTVTLNVPADAISDAGTAAVT